MGHKRWLIRYKEDDSCCRSDSSCEGHVGLVETSEDSGGSADSDVSDNSLMVNMVDSHNEGDENDDDENDLEMMALEYAIEEVETIIMSRYNLAEIFKKKLTFSGSQGQIKYPKKFSKKYPRKKKLIYLKISARLYLIMSHQYDS